MEHTTAEPTPVVVTIAPPIIPAITLQQMYDELMAGTDQANLRFPPNKVWPFLTQQHNRSKRRSKIYGVGLGANATTGLQDAIFEFFFEFGEAAAISVDQGFFCSMRSHGSKKNTTANFVALKAGMKRELDLLTAAEHATIPGRYAAHMAAAATP